jgi:hypothetical protein
VPEIARQTGTAYNTTLASYTAAVGATGQSWADALRTKTAVDLTAAGRAASGTWMQGFVSTGYSAAAGWLTGLKQMLVGNSPPPEGPLQDIDSGARAIGESWAESLAAGMASFSFPQNLETQLTPSVTPALPVTAGAGVPGGTVNNYNLHVSGRLDVDQAKDALDEMRRLETLTVRPGG